MNLSLENKFVISELKRDRYSRVAEVQSQLKKIKIPALGIGVRSKQDLETLKDLRLTYETDHIGFCVTQMVNVDDTLISISKELKEEKFKFKPTARGDQLKMFVNKTILSVEPPTEFTYYEDKDIFKKIQTSLEMPKFLKEYVSKVREKQKELGTDSEEYKNWKEQFFEDSWDEVYSNPAIMNQLIEENYDSQKAANADILIPPTPPLLTPVMFYVATRIIEETSKMAPKSTAVYFNVPLSILRDDDLREKVLNYFEKTKLPIVILKIKDLDQILDPDKLDERSAFSEIQERLCAIRKNNPKKCTILFDGGKLTYPSLVRGFDIVTNHFTGRNKRGGRRRKNSTDLIGYGSYLLPDKMIFLSYKKMLEFAKNQRKLTNNEHALDCVLPCCVDVKTLEGINREMWNFSITRPHYALTMNFLLKFISEQIYKDQIQKTKDFLLKSELCVLKNLIPDV